MFIETKTCLVKMTHFLQCFICFRALKRTERGALPADDGRIECDPLLFGAPLNVLAQVPLYLAPPLLFKRLGFRFYLFGVWGLGFKFHLLGAEGSGFTCLGLRV